MKLQQYDTLEIRTLGELERRAKEDNEAASIILEHIRVSKRDLGEWQRLRDKQKESNASQN